mgnify:CR=1 FL=1
MSRTSPYFKAFKNSLTILLIGVVSVLNISQAKAITFSDVTTYNHYYTAIQYLADEGIIHGYADGTFRSDNKVSRVEFLKILLASSNILCYFILLVYSYSVEIVISTL